MTNPSQELPFVVECRSTMQFFEPIAAFNCERVAELYLLDCAKANPHLGYRLKRPGRVCGHVALQAKYRRRIA